MIKENGYFENLLVFQKLTQSSLFPIQIHGQSKLDWVSFGKLTGFQDSHFVCGVKGGKLVIGVCVSKYLVPCSAHSQNHPPGIITGSWWEWWTNCGGEGRTGYHWLELWFWRYHLMLCWQLAVVGRSKVQRFQGRMIPGAVLKYTGKG